MMTLRLDALLQFLWEGTDEAIIEDLIARDPLRSQRQFEAARAIVETISGPSGPGARVSDRMRTVERALASNDPRTSRASRAARDALVPFAQSTDLDLRKVAFRRGPVTGRRTGARSRDSRVSSKAPDPYSIAPPPEPRSVMLDDADAERLMIHGLAIVLHLRPVASGQERTLTVTLVSSAPSSIFAEARALLWRDASAVQSASVDENGHTEFVWVDPGPYLLRLDVERQVVVLRLLRPDLGSFTEPT